MAKEVAKRSKAADLPLEPRTSIHNPHQFNGNRVSRLWAYLVRPKAAKTKLKRVLGADLAKDLDQAYKNSTCASPSSTLRSRSACASIPMPGTTARTWFDAPRPRARRAGCRC